jgi:hypothetical protein
MCAEASTILRAVAADFFFNCWSLVISSDNRIRHINMDTCNPLVCMKISPLSASVFVNKSALNNRLLISLSISMQQFRGWSLLQDL